MSNDISSVYYDMELNIFLAVNKIILLKNIYYIIYNVIEDLVLQFIIMFNLFIHRKLLFSIDEENIKQVREKNIIPNDKTLYVLELARKLYVV